MRSGLGCACACFDSRVPGETRCWLPFLRMTAVCARDSRPKLRVIAGQGGTASQPADEELIDAVVRGDASVAGALYDRLLPLVDATLFRMLGTRLPDHDDLVQSSFEQIVKTLTT